MKKPSTSAVPPPVEEASRLYPTIPSAPPDQSYRLQEISTLRAQLEAERERRVTSYKKYRRGVKALYIVDIILLVISMATGVGGVGLLSTIVAVPVVLGLEITALVCGVATVIAKIILTRLEGKAQKHDEIRVLAEAKHDSIRDLVSKALVDGAVDDHEFRLVLDEMERYRAMKENIRTNFRRVDQQTKDSLIAQGREEARVDIMKRLGHIAKPSALV